MSAFVQSMITFMEKNNQPTLQERLEYIALLASTIGGLAFERPLISLLSKVIDKTLCYYNLANGVAVELPFKLSGHPSDALLLMNKNMGEQLYESLSLQIPKHKKAVVVATNHSKDTNDKTETGEKIDEKEVLSNQNIRITNRLWYPDPLTSFAISGYLRKANEHLAQNQSSAETEHHSVLTARKVISSLKVKFKKFAGSSSPSSKQFFNACFLAGLKIGKNKSTPYFLIQYAQGNLPSASQPIQSLASIQMAKFAQNDDNGKYIHTDQWDQSQLLSSSTDDIDNISVLHEIREVCTSDNYTVLDGYRIQPIQTRQITIIRLRLILLRIGINVQTELLLKWLIYNLEANKWEYGKGTASRYLSAIGDAWLDYWVGKNIFEYDPDDMQEAFEYISWQKRISHGSAPIPLGLLYEFIGKNLTSLSIPDTIAEGGVYHHVRSDFVPEHHFQRLRVDMQSLYRKEADYFKLSVDILLIVIRRAFLRPIEAYSLRLDDIYVSDEIYLKYRKNEYAGYKTASAKRNINLSLLLKPDEIRILMNYLRCRQRAAAGNQRALLFSQSTTDEKMFDRKTINIPAIEFLSSYAGRRIAFYSIRHTGISVMQIVLNGDEEFALIVSGYDIHQIQKLKTAFQTGNLGSNYQLSSLAGHLSATTTITIYSHFTDYLLYRSLSSKQWLVSKRLLVNLLGERSKYVSALSSSDSTELHGKKTIEASRIVNKKYSLKTTEQKAFKSSSFKIIHNPISLAPIDCETVLSLYDAKKSPDEIRELTKVPKWLTSKIIEAGELIKNNQNFITRRNQSGLFEKGSRNLCPIKSVHSDEREDLETILKHLTEKGHRTSPHLGTIVFRVLSSATYARSEVFFKNPVDMKIFLQFFKKIIEFDRWSASLELTPNIRYRWDSIMDNLTMKKVTLKKKLDKNNKDGNCSLRLLRAKHYQIWDKTDVSVTLPSTSALISACHLFAIFVKTYELCQADENLQEHVSLEPLWGSVHDFLNI